MNTLLIIIALITMVLLIFGISVCSYIAICIAHVLRSHREINEIKCCTESLKEVPKIKELYDNIIDESFEEFMKINVEIFNPDPEKNNYIDKKSQKEIVGKVYANAMDRVSPAMVRVLTLAYGSQGLEDYTIRKLTLMTVETIAVYCNSQI